MRFTQNELNNAMKPIKAVGDMDILTRNKNIEIGKDKKPLPQEEPSKHVYYVKKGDEDFLNELGHPVVYKRNNNVLAMKKHLAGGITFFIKESNTTTDIFFNPIAIAEYSHKHASGGVELRFIRVRKEIFNLYLEFLRTGKEYLLKNAEGSYL